MTFVALLRGINVGGQAKIEMAKLKMTFERLGFSGVKTYINSGNVIFEASSDPSELAKSIAQAIHEDFNLAVPVLVRDFTDIEKLVQGVPTDWVNDTQMKCDVIFLMEALDSPGILSQIPHNPDIEDVIYLPGAVIWRINRDKVKPGQPLKITGAKDQLTVRNINTVRKLYELMRG